MLDRTIVPRALIAGAAALLLLGVGSTAAQADSRAIETKGDLSWRAQAVARLANCSASQWYNATYDDCIAASGNSYWDSVHLVSADYQIIQGKQVAWQGGDCPRMGGFEYIKCYYVGGKHRGNPVITISVKSNESNGMVTSVNWYYL